MKAITTAAAPVNYSKMTTVALVSLLKKGNDNAGEILNGLRECNITGAAYKAAIIKFLPAIEEAAEEVPEAAQVEVVAPKAKKGRKAKVNDIEADATLVAEPELSDAQLIIEVSNEAPDLSEEQPANAPELSDIAVGADGIEEGVETQKANGHATDLLIELSYLGAPRALRAWRHLTKLTNPAVNAHLVNFPGKIRVSKLELEGIMMSAQFYGTVANSADVDGGSVTKKVLTDFAIKIEKLIAGLN